MQIIMIEVDEAEKCFRVNGVTIAKRHLGVLFPNEEMPKALAKYLALVPILASRRANGLNDNGELEATKYGAVKSTRVFEALALPADAVVPFMTVCAQQAMGDGVPVASKQSSPRVTRYGGKDDNNVIDITKVLDKVRRTLH